MDFSYEYVIGPNFRAGNIFDRGNPILQWIWLSHFKNRTPLPFTMRLDMVGVTGLEPVTSTV